LDIPESVLSKTPDPSAREKRQLPTVSVSYSNKSFSIEDNCGGISYADALNDVFNFGHAPGYSNASGGRRLGAYGIGLKRAVFKIGKLLTMRSRTLENGFQTKLNVEKWAETDDTLEDWRIPIEPIDAASSLKTAGTRIVIENLRDEVKTRLHDGEF